MPLCEKNSDVFTLKSDKTTVNNFYAQKLKLNDTSPHIVKRVKWRNRSSTFCGTISSNQVSQIITVPLFWYRKRAWMVEKRCVWIIEQAIKISSQQISTARYFSALGLLSGFHQIPLHEDSRDITSFSTN